MIPSGSVSRDCNKILAILIGKITYNWEILYTRTAPKAMPLLLLCWPTTSEADVSGMAVDVEPSADIPLHFVAV